MASSHKQAMVSLWASGEFTQAGYGESLASGEFTQPGYGRSLTSGEFTQPGSWSVSDVW